MSSALINTNSLSSIEINSLLLSRVRTVVKFYIWPLLALFGLTGNFLSILVLTRRRLIRTSTNNYLTALAAFDSCYLILTLLLNFSSHPKFSRFSFPPTCVYILRTMTDFSSNAATWLIVCFTLERTLAVAKPIYAKRTCSVRRSRRLICSLLTICLLVTLPTFLEQGLVRDTHSEEINYNATQPTERMKRREFFQNLHLAYLVFICVVIVWIPLILLCVCNSILIWYVHRSRQYDNKNQANNAFDSYETSSSTINRLEYSSQNYRRSSLTSSSSVSGPTAFYLRRHSRSVIQKRKVTIILIFCLFVALLLWTPQSLSLTYETMIQSFSEMSQDHRITLLIFNNFANLFVCINASIDFILYCFLSEKFARTCRQIICRQCYVQENKPTHRTRMISVDRTSFILAQAPTNLYNQQLAANKTNKYYVQLYDIYRNSSGMKTHPDKKWKRKFAQSLTTNMKSDNLIFYQRSLSKTKPAERYGKDNKVRVNLVSNPVIEYVDDDDKINEEAIVSVETLTNSPPK